jgi:hypothetical protein
LLTVFIAGVLCLSLIAGCGGDKGSNPTTGSISGTVFKANSPYPVYGVFISCAGKSTTTDFSGAYAIDDLPLGTQTLSATKDDYKFFTTTVTITGNETHDIFIVSSKDDGGDLGEG